MVKSSYSRAFSAALVQPSVSTFTASNVAIIYSAITGVSTQDLPAG
jgi:hypothetical protein